MQASLLPHSHLLLAALLALGQPAAQGTSNKRLSRPQLLPRARRPPAPSAGPFAARQRTACSCRPPSCRPAKKEIEPGPHSRLNGGRQGQGANATARMPVCFQQSKLNSGQSARGAMHRGLSLPDVGGQQGLHCGMPRSVGLLAGWPEQPARTHLQEKLVASGQALELASPPSSARATAVPATPPQPAAYGRHWLQLNAMHRVISMCRMMQGLDRLNDRLFYQGSSSATVLCCAAYEMCAECHQRTAANDGLALASKMPWASRTLDGRSKGRNPTSGGPTAL